MNINCRCCGEEIRLFEEVGEGQYIRCPLCQGEFRVPVVDRSAVLNWLDAIDNHAASTTPASDGSGLVDGTAEQDPHQLKSADPDPRPIRSSRKKKWRPDLEGPEARRPCILGRRAYLVFGLALIPLLFSYFRPDDVESRLRDTLEKNPRLAETLTTNNGMFGKSELLTALPGRRLVGAWLPFDSLLQWLLGPVSGAMFLAIFLVMFARGGARIVELLGVAAFTATAGIVLLLLFQVVASVAQNYNITGGSIIVLLFYIVKLIGFSYRAATDPNSDFLVSLFGFTLGVGLCEEVAKALPLLRFRESAGRLGWRGMAQWGLASGAGFGTAEAVMYSTDFYNGLSAGSIYLVRFISCVALHAIWSAAVGIGIYKRRRDFFLLRSWDVLIPLVMVAGVPMALHGLYDTLLKHSMELPALLTALISFAWLAWQIETSWANEPAVQTTGELAAAPD